MKNTPKSSPILAIVILLLVSSACGNTSTPTPIVVQAAAGASCIPNNPAQTGKVIDVVDGDTIKVRMDQDGQTYTIRYIGMDTPESTTQIEYFGPEAASKNRPVGFREKCDFNKRRVGNRYI